MRDEYEITDSIQILIDDGHVVRHQPIVERDLNLTKPEDLLTINLAELERRHLDHLIGDGVEMPAGTVVHKSVIGDNVVVRHPIRIAHSVVLPGVVVESTVDLDGVVMDSDHAVQCPSVTADTDS
jgi:dTDP-glucose pyrophosphorylase